MRQVHRLVANTEPAPAPAAEPAAVQLPAAVKEPAEAVTVERIPEPAPEAPALAPAPEPEPIPEPVPVPAPAEPRPMVPPISRPALPAVPAALVDHARKIADTYRATTGRPIDTDTLRTRLGVPPILADAITAQLT